jgi:hypothetical protein
MSIVNPLPIELLYFKGKQIDNGNLIEWVTATETNNNYFKLYRSGYPIKWNEVAKVDGVGTSSFSHYYRYIDEDFISEISYYYLSQTDFDGRSKDFYIISVNNNKIKPIIISITNTLGQEVNIEFVGLKFFHYSDGTIVKIY